MDGQSVNATPTTRSLYLLDGHYQIFRAYYAPMPPLTSPTGEPTTGIHAFCGMLFNLLLKRKPDYLAMVMDVSDATVFRRDIYPDYKTNREPPPEDFGPQADRIVAIVKAMGIPILRLPGFEADDLLATIAEQLADHDLDVFLLSRDKDLHQLLTDRIHMYDPVKDQTLNAATLLETKGFTPAQAVEIQTLSGDSVDNIPGVVGIGPKTALKLISKYGTAQNVVENAAELTPKQSERVKAFAEQIDLTRTLVTLRRDVPMTFDLEACRRDAIPIDRVIPIFDELGFSRLRGQLESFAGPDEPPSAPKPPPPTIKGTYDLIDTPEKLDSLVERLAAVKTFAFDTETTGLNPVRSHLVGISISWEAGTGCYIPTRTAIGDALPIDLVVDKLKPIFEDPSVTKCGQNLKFDMLVLRQVGIEVAGPAFDTMIAAYLLDPLRASHGLDALSRELLNHTMIPITDLIGKGKNQITIDQVDTARVGEYASEDADFTWRLFEYFQPRMAESAVRSVFETVEMPLVAVLAEMEHNGIALDSAALAEMGDAMGDRLYELTEQIHKLAGYKFNIDSTKQLAIVLFDEQGLEVVRKTKTGRSTDAETLSALAATTTNEIPPLILEYREIAKLKSTYVDTLPSEVCERTGRIHSSFNQMGAATGRLSSSNPNLQNIPVRTEMGRRIRAAFVAADTDHVLLAADYSQVELRVLAHFCEDEHLLEAFRREQDIHAFVAAQVNGVALAEVTKEQRAAAKAVNFGIIYGQTPFGLSRALGIPMSEAKAFIDTYFLRYPGIRWFIDRCVKEAKARGYAETITGRQRPVPELASRNGQRVSMGERIAVNTVVQGSAADLIKRAMYDIHHAIKSEDRPSRMLIQVHDELVFEIPKEHVESEAEMIREKMTTAIPLNVPVVVDIKWGKNWLEGK